MGYIRLIVFLFNKEGQLLVTYLLTKYFIL